MKLTYYYKNTTLTIERKGNFNQAEYDELVRRICQEPTSIIVDFVDDILGHYEGALSGLDTFVKSKVLGLSDN